MAYSASMHKRSKSATSASLPVGADEYLLSKDLTFEDKRDAAKDTRCDA